MNSIVRSATLVALLGFQDNALVSKGKVDEYSVLAAVFRDLYPVVRSIDIPLSRSATQALEHCRRAQDELMQLLHSVGLLKSTGSTDGLLDQIYHFVRRFTHRQSLQRAKENYRNSVFLLRDITMDAVTHYHLQHMRHELDHLCGGWDRSKIDITVNQEATTPTMERVKSGRPTENEQSSSEQGKWVQADESSLRFKGTTHVDTRDIPLRGLFDTGSDRNFVSLSFLQKHGIYDTVVQKLPRPETVKGAEKMMQTKIEHEAPLKWCMDGSDTRTDAFFVIDNDGDSYDILLGWEFIAQNEIFAVKRKAPDRVRRMPRIKKKTRQEIRAWEDALDRQEEDPRDRELGQIQDARDMRRMGGSSTATTTINSPSSFGPSPPGLGIFSPTTNIMTTATLHSPQPTPRR